jgi:hypothetical protein
VRLVLSMARPTLRSKSTNVYFRERIPADVKAVARGQTLVIPVGDAVVPVAHSKTANEVKVSLRTADRCLASAWGLGGLQRGAREPFASSGCCALAGKVYRLFTNALEDNPGSAPKWERVHSLASSAWRAS